MVQYTVPMLHIEYSNKVLWMKWLKSACFKLPAHARNEKSAASPCLIWLICFFLSQGGAVNAIGHSRLHLPVVYTPQCCELSIHSALVPNHQLSFWDLHECMTSFIILSITNIWPVLSPCDDYWLSKSFLCNRQISRLPLAPLVFMIEVKWLLHHSATPACLSCAVLFPVFKVNILFPAVLQCSIYIPQHVSGRRSTRQRLCHSLQWEHFKHFRLSSEIFINFSHSRSKKFLGNALEKSAFFTNSYFVFHGSPRNSYRLKQHEGVFSFLA